MSDSIPLWVVVVISIDDETPFDDACSIEAARAYITWEC